MPVDEREFTWSGMISIGSQWVGWRGEDRHLYLLDLDSDAEAIDLGEGLTLLVDEDHQLLATLAVDGAVEVFALPSLELVQHWNGDGMRSLADVVAVGHTVPIPGGDMSEELLSALAISADGTVLYHGRQVFLTSFDIASGATIASVSVPEPGTFEETDTVAANLVPFADGSGRLISGGAAFAVLFDGPSLRRVAPVAVPPFPTAGAIAGYELLADGSLATLLRSGALKVIDPLSGEDRHPELATMSGRGKAIGLSGDGSLAAVAGPGAVSLLAAIGDGPVRQAVARAPDEWLLGLGRDAGWLVVDGPWDYDPASIDRRTGGRRFRCDPRCDAASAERSDPRLLHLFDR